MARGRESAKRTAERRTAHYRDVFRQVLRDARALDPDVDARALRREFEVRRDFLEEQQQEYAASGRDPHDLLRAVASYGGLWFERKTGGFVGEIEFLKEGARLGGVAGVPGVFRKNGLTPDGMREALRQDQRFEWIEDINDLLDALNVAVRQGEAKLGPVFPGSEAFAASAGMTPTEQWWDAPWFAEAPVEPKGLTAETYREAFGGTKEQAEAIVAVIDAMGIPLDRLRVVKGGTPGSGALRQDRDGLRRFLEGDPVASLTGNEFAPGEGPLTDRVARWYRDHDDARVEVPSIGEVRLDSRAVRTSIGHGLSRQKVAAFAAVPAVLRRGRVVHVGPWQEREKTGRAIVVAAPIAIGDTPHVALVLVHEDPNARRMYVHEVAVRDEIPRRRSGPGRPSDEGAHSGAGGGFLRSILESIFAVKSGPDDPGVLFQDAVEPAPIFYSQLRQVIDAKMANRASAGQVLAMLAKPTSGVKAEEVQWSGLRPHRCGATSRRILQPR